MPTISTRALGLVAADLGLDLPYPLEAPHPGATAAERAELRQKVEEELRDRDLLDHGGQVAAKLERWLRMLARPEVSVDSAFLPALGKAPVRAVVARSGRSAVLVAQPDDEVVRLRPVPLDQLGAVIVDLLPPASRGTEGSISLPVTNEEGGRTIAEDRQVLARMVASPRERGGQLAANSFSDLRGRRRSAVLSWFDNDTGRYFAQQGQARDGGQWVTIVPADAAALRHRVGEMVATVTP